MAMLFTLLLSVAAAMLGWMLAEFSAQVTPEQFAPYQTLGVAIMAIMAVVVVTSFGISYFVVSRVNHIATTAHEIVATKDLSRRIAVDTAWDDLSNLAQLLNDFLGKMELQMTRVREVSNNIAHDLRTPLSGLRSDIESLRGTTVTDHHLDALIADTDKMMRVFQSLLRITNIEQGKRTHAFSVVDMHALLRDVMELYEPVAEEKHITLVPMLTTNLSLRGDADLLFQLFANLLDNAVKFSPQGAAIEVQALPERERMVVTVTDHGCGIAEAEKENVFRHFYRGDASRSTEGNGLGLSLVKAVVEQHQGQIALEDVKPGLRVRVTLPSYQ